jgi:hypothetical protein
VADAYGDAVLRAEGETDLPRDTFPESCPYAFQQVMDDGSGLKPAPEPGPLPRREGE